MAISALGISGPHSETPRCLSGSKRLRWHPASDPGSEATFLAWDAPGNNGRANLIHLTMNGGIQKLCLARKEAAVAASAKLAILPNLEGRRMISTSLTTRTAQNICKQPYSPPSKPNGACSNNSLMHKRMFSRTVLRFPRDGLSGPGAAQLGWCDQVLCCPSNSPLPKTTAFKQGGWPSHPHTA